MACLSTYPLIACMDGMAVGALFPSGGFVFSFSFSFFGVSEMGQVR
jgi:hypothetical protein